MVAVGDPVILARMPGFLAGLSQETGDSSTFTTETQIGSVTASLIEGVRYWVRCPAKLRSTVVDDVIRATLYEDSTSGTMLCFCDIANPATSGSRTPIYLLEALFTATATGSKTFVATGTRVSGSGNVSRDVLSTAPQTFSITVAD